ncbi:MAG: hypothetical protein AAF438_08005 [Pseudomonadota bacterium]
MIRIPRIFATFAVASMMVACGGGGGSNDNGSSSSSGGGSSSGSSSGGGNMTGCINSSVSGGAYFIGAFTGIEPAPIESAFNITNSEAGCGGLGTGNAYTIAFTVPDPGDPGDGDFIFQITLDGNGSIPMVAADQPADVLMTFPLSASPGRGGFFNGVDCFVTITAVPEEPNQSGGRLFYPEGTVTCSRFELNPGSAAITGPQPDILITPSDSVVQFLGAVATI